MEVETKCGIFLTIEAYNNLQQSLDDALTQLERVDYFAQSVRDMTDDDFAAFCKMVCSGCREQGIPDYCPRYDLPTSHALDGRNCRCNAHIFLLFRSGRQLSQDSMCDESEGRIRWYRKLKDGPVRV